VTTRRNLIRMAGLVAAYALGLAGPAARAEAPPPAARDHIIYAVPDLAAAAAEIEAAWGVAPVFGGVHPGRGTANYLLSLGGGAYLEILGPNPDGDDGQAAPVELKALDGPVLLTFALRTPDADKTAAALDAAGIAADGPTPGERATPDGGVLRWRSLVVADHGYCEYMPFLIEWAAASAHPSSTSPQGVSLEALEIAFPDAAGLNRHYSALGASVTAKGASTPLMRVTLKTSNGDIVLEKSGGCPAE